MPINQGTMNTDKQALADFRARIDKMDVAIHDILRDRAEIIDQVRKLKGKQQIFLRPGREATMVRALLSRPQGKIPDGLIVRLWREMISAFTMMEGQFKVAVYAKDKGEDLWDITRDYFGSYTPLIESATSQAAIKAIQSGKATFAVLPAPQQGEKDSWWQTLAADKTNAITVFATVPFEIMKAGRSNARHSMPTGFVLGKLYPELTGDDRSFLAMQCVHVPEAEMRRLIGKAGYKLRQLFSHQAGRGGSSPMLFMVEVDGFVGRNDTRISRLRAMLGSRMQHLMPLGGYAVPVKAGKR